MAGCYLLCALFVCLNILVFAVEGSTHIKGLFCQDPDTRKLYPINSTWASESFCGNYTCKLRKKNVTQTEYEPVANINITAPEQKNKTLTSDMDTSPSEQAFVVIKKIQPADQSTFHKEAINKLNILKDELYNGSTDTDRYLTESEIKSITEILRTVKKSDLDAIVEIYNIAQDIYKEFDKKEEEKVIKDVIDNLNTINVTEKNNVKEKLKSSTKDFVSYWYEPLHHVSTKGKSADLKVEGTNPAPTTKIYSHPATYFKGPLTERDFKNLPYYYPMSNFQRMSSYLHKKAPQNLEKSIPFNVKPCNKNFDNVALAWSNIQTKFKVKPEPAKPHMIQQNMLLPYPFAYVSHHYNISKYPPSFYYNFYPWTQLNPYSSLQNYPQHYFGAYYSQVPNTVVGQQISAEIQRKSDARNTNTAENIKSMDKAVEGHLPEWQTEELSAKVLEEVKANILEDSKLIKPLNIGKNLKLEKVGKVIKLDELIRTKRDINNIENEDIDFDIKQYEPYIEKTTCESSPELGYFRIGNMTEPYPACCPQKIS